MMFKFLNRTNGKYQDAEVFWSFKGTSGTEVHSIAEQPLFDMPANSSGRMYFYLGTPNSLYFDFIEFTIGPAQFNGNTTRVDAFGLKIAMRLHCADGFDVAVGEDYPTFLEDRAVTFQDSSTKCRSNSRRSRNRTPLIGSSSPARGISRPAVHTSITTTRTSISYGRRMESPSRSPARMHPAWDRTPTFPRPSSGTLANRLVQFTADGKVANKMLWSSAASFYGAAPANYYARFWHSHAIDGKAYGFPYDDVGGYSSYVSHGNPQYMLIAVGW